MLSDREKYIRNFLENFNKLWIKNYADLNLTEVLINLPRLLGKKDIKDLSDDEVLESMEILSQKIKKKTDVLGTTEDLMKTIEDKWKKFENLSFMEFFDKTMNKLNTDLITANALSLEKILKKTYE